MLLSFIVPAYNEEALLGASLEAIEAAANSCACPFEIIVVDDASTDRTREIAVAHGARVVSVRLRHIAAVRNAGAKEASGDVLVFVDADTIVPAGVVLGALRAIESGAVGGGSLVRFDGRVPLLTRLYLSVFFMVMRWMKWAAGCFLFAAREPYFAVGGFDERYFVGEELHLSSALKRRGRFVIVSEPVLTSGRKTRLYSPAQIYGICFRMLISGPKAWRHREGLGLWYDGRREATAAEEPAPSQSEEKPTP